VNMKSVHNTLTLYLVLGCTALSAPACTDDPSVALETELEPSAVTTHTVSTATELQHAIDAAQPGHVIVLRDGAYAGRFRINGASGDAARITITAEHRHRAILRGTGATDLTNIGLRIERPGWIINGLRLEGYFYAIYTNNTTPTDLEIRNNIITDYTGRGL